jgi:hypothetical protein
VAKIGKMHNSRTSAMGSANLLRSATKTTAAGTALLFQPDPSQFYAYEEKWL